MLTVDFERVGLRPGATLLDIGCGEGRHTCGAFLRGGIHAVGVDLDVQNVAKTRNMLREMQRQGMGAAGKWEVLAGDTTSLPFGTDAFDVVICSEVLEHIGANRLAVAELVRVLKPGGTLAVSVPRYLPERICWALSDAYHNNDGGHIRIYRKKELIRLLEEAGMRCRASHFAHALHSPYWWLKCLVGVHEDQNLPVRLYHRFLVWDIMKHPPLTRILERLLNPVLGKSLVLYLQKGVGARF